MRLIDADALKNMRFSCAMHDDNYIVYVPMREVNENIDKAPTIGGWISVKDRLPIEKENPLTHDFAEVICFCDFGGLPRRTDIRMYKFGKPSWETEPHFWHGPQNMDGIVTYWMPLPELPKVGEDE